LKYFDLVLSTLNQQKFEVLYGLPGYLYILISLQKYFGPIEGDFHVDCRSEILKICFLIVERGFESFDPSTLLKKYLEGPKELSFPKDFRLKYDFHNREYIGGAHGLFGVIQMLLLSFQLVKDYFLEKEPRFTEVMLQAVRASLSTLERTQLKSGRK
jgi:hypothetical protein